MYNKLTHISTTSDQSDIIPARSGYVMPHILDICMNLTRYFKAEYDLSYSVQELLAQVFSLTLKAMVEDDKLPTDIITIEDFEVLTQELEKYGIQHPSFVTDFSAAAIKVGDSLDKQLLHDKV